jgi:hypothetical protein
MFGCNSNILPLLLILLLLGSFGNSGADYGCGCQG